MEKEKQLGDQSSKKMRENIFMFDVTQSEGTRNFTSNQPSRTTQGQSITSQMDKGDYQKFALMQQKMKPGSKNQFIQL